MSGELELVPPGPRWPPGFRYLPDVFDPATAEALMRELEGWDFEPYVMHGTPSKRGVRFFGAAYGRTQGTAAEPIPDLLLPIRERACAAVGLAPDPFVQALAIRYPPGAGIGWHADIAAYGPDVIGVSLGAPCRFLLRPKVAPREVVELTLAPGSVYLIGGESRTDWQHHIPPTRSGVRFSLTFRTVRPRRGRGAAA